MFFGKLKELQHSLTPSPDTADLTFTIELTKKQHASATMSKQNIIILGGSGIGMIASSILDRVGGFRMLGFLNDVVPVGSEIGKYRRHPVIGKSEDVNTLIKKHDAMVFVAYIGMTKERETAQKIKSLDIPVERLLTIIDPSAVVPHGYCSIGNGCLLCPLAQLSADTTIEDNVIMLPNSFLGHDSTLEEFASVANNACIGANVNVGYASHIGTNASIREKLRIGRHSVVGMGAVVLTDVPEDAIVVGNPARVQRIKTAR
jgi:acetyltransferase EpsM